MTEFREALLGDLVVSLDNVRRPVRSQDRKPGPYPYYGASGIVDSVSDYLFEGLHLLVAEDGENLRTRKTPIAFLADGKFWVNNHAHVVKANNLADTRYLAYAIEAADVSGFLTGSTQPKLTKDSLMRLLVPAPELNEQQAIAGVLGALDDKIESNRRLSDLLDELFLTECAFICESSDGWPTAKLSELAEISLGGTPSRADSRYWEGGHIPWINSGCLHERPVLTPADWITDIGLEKSATKVIPAGATAVAITGATLGVTSRLAIPVAINQSVVTIVTEGDRAMNDYLYYWLCRNISQLVSSATGAAQQHVNKSNFADLQVAVPSAHVLCQVNDLAHLLDKQVEISKQSKTLQALRDALLPELLSGRLRVRDAVKVVEEVV